LSPTCVVAVEVGQEAVQGVEEALEVRVLPFVGTGVGEVILQLSITRSAPKYLGEGSA
jgi:hypothetical protein